MSDSESSSGPEDRRPSQKDKKKKNDEPPAKKHKKAKEADDEEGDGDGWSLGKLRKITVSNFKGQARVDLRDYYEAPDGSMKPTKKANELNTNRFYNDFLNDRGSKFLQQ